MYLCTYFIDMDTLIDLGYWGLFIGSFLASTIIPMSADVLLVGVLTLGGNEWLCLGIATIGNWLGGLTSYGIGWIGKWEWIEKWFKIKEEKLIQQKKYIDRYGVWLALFTWLPFVGDLFDRQQNDAKEFPHDIHAALAK